MSRMPELNASLLPRMETDPSGVRRIRWLGRTRFDPETGVRSVFYTASGFEVRFSGSSVDAVLLAPHLSDPDRGPRLALFLDGEEDPRKAGLLVLREKRSRQVLASGLPEGIHTLRVLKRSEALEGDLGVLSLATDGTFLPAPEAKSFRIQYIGDSTLAGFGNLSSSVEEPKTPANSDGLWDLAYLSAYAHGADFSLVCSSGWGISRGWNTPGGSRDPLNSIPAAYECVAIDGSNAIRRDWGLWDFSLFRPDLLVITLGTNDFNAPGYDQMAPAAQKELRESFVADYLAFLKRLDALHPGVPVLLVYGIMADAWRIGEAEREVVAKASASLPGRYAGLEVVAAGTTHPFGSSYHPQAETHMEAAAAVSREITRLTGHPILRQNLPRR